MLEIITQLEAEKKAHEDEAKRREEAIRALRACCPHPEWEEAGHDSHNDYQRCTRCGLVR